MVTVQCWPSDVSLISTTSMFVVLSIDMVLIAFSTALSKQKRKKPEQLGLDGALFFFKNRNSNFFGSLKHLYIPWKRCIWPLY